MWKRNLSIGGAAVGGVAAFVSLQERTTVIDIALGAGIWWLIGMGIGALIDARKKRSRRSVIGVDAPLRDAPFSSDDTANFSQPETKICPWCAEDIKPAAMICRYCGRDVPPVQPRQIEVPPVQPRQIEVPITEDRWLPDPVGSDNERLWNGHRWTDHVRDAHGHYRSAPNPKLTGMRAPTEN